MSRLTTAAASIGGNEDGIGSVGSRSGRDDVVIGGCGIRVKWTG